jgi:hypothetical protein
MRQWVNRTRVRKGDANSFAKTPLNAAHAPLAIAIACQGVAVFDVVAIDCAVLGGFLWF